MGTNIRLVNPSEEWREEYLAFYRDWKESGEDIAPWIVKLDPEDFPSMLQTLRDGEDDSKVPEGRVPASAYWLITEEGRVAGAVSFRHSLNESLLNRGGHIGYGIRPGFRGRGLAVKQLALALDKARERGLDRVLVTCDFGNVPSRRTILRNGGVPDTDFIEEDGNVVQRFWIDLKRT